MSTAISYVNISTPIPYAALSDVNNLIGSVISAADVSTQQINSEIVASSKYIEKKCNQVFRPRTVRFNQDGANAQVCLSTITPIININEIEIYTYNLLGLRRILFDYQLVIDSKTGVLAYPLTNNITLSPNFSFLSGVQNLRFSVHQGFTETVYDETLTTKDLITYKFANPYVIEYTELPGPNSSQQPLISPLIYVNGVYQANRTYSWEMLNTVAYLGAVQEPFSTETWMVGSDNLIYTTNYTSLGITGVTFNSALPVGSTVTCMYRHAVIPEDIAQATAKHAAVNILRSVATGIYSDLQFMGVDQIQDNNARIMANTGRFESQITGFLLDVKETIVANKSTVAGIVGNSVNSPYMRSGSTDSFNRL